MGSDEGPALRDIVPGAAVQFDSPAERYADSRRAGGVEDVAPVLPANPEFLQAGSNHVGIVVAIQVDGRDTIVVSEVDGVRPGGTEQNEHVVVAGSAGKLKLDLAGPGPFGREPAREGADCLIDGDGVVATAGVDLNRIAVGQGCARRGTVDENVTGRRPRNRNVVRGIVTSNEE